MINSFITPIMIEKYAKRLVARLKSPSLRGVVLTGSFARGEAGPFSDLDVWCFYDGVSRKTPVLPQLTGLSLDLREVSIADFRDVADGSREYVAPCFEQLKVFGETPFALPSQKEIREGVMKLLHSIHRRIKCVVPPVNHYEILNDIMYLLRIEWYFATYEYPLTLSELYLIQIEESDRMLVEHFASYLFGEGKEKVSADEFRSIINSFLNKRL